MAVGPITVLDRAIEKTGRGVFNFATDAFRLALCTKDEAMSAAYAGTSGSALYADLQHETAGAGYAAGGLTLAGVAWTRTGSVTLFSANPAVWEALTATMKYGVIYRDAGDKDIVAFFDLELSDPDGRISGGGDFIITFADGVFDLTRTV